MPSHSVVFSRMLFGALLFHTSAVSRSLTDWPGICSSLDWVHSRHNSWWYLTFFLLMDLLCLIYPGDSDLAKTFLFWCLWCWHQMCCRVLLRISTATLPQPSAASGVALVRPLFWGHGSVRGFCKLASWWKEKCQRGSIEGQQTNNPCLINLSLRLKNKGWW